MIRCNKCDVRIESKADCRVRFALQMWCPDIRSRTLYQMDGSRITDEADLCASCQDEAFAALEQLAVKFRCEKKPEEPRVPVVCESCGWPDDSPEPESPWMTCGQCDRKVSLYHPVKEKLELVT